MAHIIVLLGSIAIEIQMKEGFASEIAQLLSGNRLSWEEIVWLLRWQGSLWDQEAARWVYMTSFLKVHGFADGFAPLWQRGFVAEERGL